MASDTPRIAEQGLATLPDEAWELARRRTEIIGPLAALDWSGIKLPMRLPRRWACPGDRCMSSSAAPGKA